MSERMIIVGAGGHAQVVAAAIKVTYEDILIVGFLDDFTPPSENNGILGDFKLFPLVAAAKNSKFAHIALGDSVLRRNFLRDTVTGTIKFPPIIHKTAITSGAHIGEGSFVAAGSLVGTKSVVGSFSIINTKATVDHGSMIGDFCHLAPGVTTGGRVTIGNDTFIGIGACIRDGITIGKNCVIGMGSVCTKDIPDGTVAYGNPARPVRLAC
jgi:sugar O-acyltransferase (sialic acid O-acetyltransferase NeuD family)